MSRVLAVLVLALLVAGPAAAQSALRVEPPAGGLVGPTLGGGVDSVLPPSVPAEAETPELVVDLSVPRVSITSAFHGERILLFGMFDPPGEIVVVVAGPSARETVLRKQRVFGLWLNTSRQPFDDVPTYYAVAASQPLQRLLARAPGEILSLEDRLATIKPIGHSHRTPEQFARFRAGLIEVKRREGLYPAAIGQVTIQAQRLFRVDLTFPSRIPEGVYDVKTYLVREGRVVAAVSRPLPVGKVGFNADVAGWAVHEGPLYGVGAILMALIVGWVGGAVMRRL